MKAWMIKWSRMGIINCLAGWLDYERAAKWINARTFCRRRHKEFVVIRKTESPKHEPMPFGRQATESWRSPRNQEWTLGNGSST